MKNTLLIFLTVFVSIVSIAQTKQFYSTNTNGSETQVKIRDDKQDIEVSYGGKFILSDDQRKILSMDDGSFLRVRSGEKKLSVRQTTGGIRYTINNQPESAELSSDGAQLLNELLQIAVDNGLNAKERAMQLFRQGNASAVIAEVKKKSSAYVRQLYLSSLLDNNLSSEDIVAALDAVKDNISEDYAKASLLKKVLRNVQLSESGLDNLLNAAGTIESDYEKSSVLTTALKLPASSGYSDKILSLTAGVSSDYEKAEVLKTAAAQSPTFAESPKFLAALKDIRSDYEKSGVLKSYLKKKTGKLPYSQIITAIKTIASDYEKASVFAAVINARSDQSDQDWLLILPATEQINSDYEKANVLSLIAKNLTTNDEVQKAFVKAAKTINSDHEYGRLMKKAGK